MSRVCQQVSGWVAAGIATTRGKPLGRSRQTRSTTASDSPSQAINVQGSGPRLPPPPSPHPRFSRCLPVIYESNGDVDDHQRVGGDEEVKDPAGEIKRVKLVGEPRQDPRQGNKWLQARVGHVGADLKVCVCVCCVDTCE